MDFLKSIIRMWLALHWTCMSIWGRSPSKECGFDSPSHYFITDYMYVYIYIIWEACQVLPPWNYSFKEGLTSLGSDTACWANPQQVYFLTLFGSSPSILPALSLCRDAPFTLTLHPAVLFNLLSNCFVSTDGITTPPCREGMEKRKKAWEREGIFLIFSSYIGSVSFTLDNFLDFMFQFFDTSFNYVSHGHFYICCISLFSIS